LRITPHRVRARLERENGHTFEFPFSSLNVR
jgi:hypothetical protein